MREPDWQAEDGAIRLWRGDCRELLPEMERVDAVVTDPPFGISFDRATWKDDIHDYPSIISMLVTESNRLVVRGRVFVFQAMPNVSRFHEWFPEGWRIFAACKNFAQIRPTGVWHSWDPVVFWENGKPKRSGDVNRDYFVGNVAGVFGDGIDHPCPRPRDTMEYIAQIAAPKNETILDPFMGSGTTGVACVRTGRRFIGIEIDPHYFQIAVDRIKAALAQPDMFLEAERPEAVQEAFA